jgi:conjugative transfer signal peptidase TraF
MPRNHPSQIPIKENVIKMAGLLVRLKNTSLGAVWRIALTAIVVLIVTFQVCGLAGLRFNTSPSLPIGLYITSSDARANLVEFCPAEPFASLGIIRGYRDPGVCPDGGAPLLKPAITRPGDVVELSARGIAVNGVLLRNTAPLSQDTKGRPLTSWSFGRYLVTPGTVWVASLHHPRSFDSRYLGPISTSSIRDHLRPLLTEQP